MKLNEGLLTERLGLIREDAPLDAEITIKVFTTQKDAADYHEKEFSMSLETTTGFATAWDELSVGEKTEKRLFGMIGIVQENWAEYADTLEDMDAVLVEEYMHLVHRFRPGSLIYDFDYADYIAISDAIGIGMTPEMASYNIKHLEESVRILNLIPDSPETGIDTFTNDFARAAALMSGPHKPVYKQTALSIRRKVGGIMKDYVSLLPKKSKEKIGPYAGVLLSPEAYSSSFTAEKTKAKISSHGK